MRRPPRPFALFHGTFLLTGTATVLLGVLLAHGAGQSGDRRSGELLAAQFCGQLVGSLLLLRRASRSLAIGLGVVAMASATMAWAGGVSPGLLLLLGVGLGMVMASVNVAAGQASGPERRGRVLELLNVFWPIGAALCAPAETLVSRTLRPSAMYGVVAGLLAVCLLALLATRQNAGEVRAAEAAIDRPVSLTTLGLLSLVALLVVGVETGISGWLPTLAQRAGCGPRMIAATTAAFWCGSLASRLAASYLLRRVSLQRLSGVAAAAAVVCCGLLPAFAQPSMLLLIAVGCACSIAPLYPALLAQCVQLRGKQFVFLSAGLGAALVPWTVGQASGAAGSLRVAMLVPFAGAVLMVLAMWRAGLFSQRDPTPDDTAV